MPKISPIPAVAALRKFDAVVRLGNFATDLDRH